MKKGIKTAGLAGAIALMSPTAIASEQNYGSLKIEADNYLNQITSVEAMCYAHSSILGEGWKLYQRECDLGVEDEWCEEYLGFLDSRLEEHLEECK